MKKQIKKKIELRIRNLHNSLAVARLVNPIAIICINSSIDTLRNFSDPSIDFRTLIKECSDEARLITKRRNKNRELILRAKWHEFNWLKNNLR